MRFPRHLNLACPPSFCVQMDLGPVPCLSLTRRMLTLASSSHAYTFAWDLDPALVLEGGLRIEPAEGRVEPYGQLIFKVVYKAGAWAELFDVELTLGLTPEPQPLSPPTPLSGEQMLHVRVKP